MYIGTGAENAQGRGGSTEGQGEGMKWGSIRNRSAAEIPTQVGDLKPEMGNGWAVIGLPVWLMVG